MATLVAVSIVPTNTPCTTSVKPGTSPFRINGRDTSRPSSMGTATPTTATTVASAPVFFSSAMSVSSPAENIIIMTPILANTSSTVNSPPSITNSSSAMNDGVLLP